MTAPLVDQPTAAPTQKVAAAGVGGAASIVLVYGADLLGLELPPAVAAAIVTVVAFAAAYFKRNRVVDTPGQHAAPED